MSPTIVTAEFFRSSNCYNLLGFTLPSLGEDIGKLQGNGLQIDRLYGIISRAEFHSLSRAAYLYLKLYSLNRQCQAKSCVWHLVLCANSIKHTAQSPPYHSLPCTIRFAQVQDKRSGTGQAQPQKTAACLFRTRKRQKPNEVRLCELLYQRAPDCNS